MEHNNTEGSLKVMVMLECNQLHQTQTGVSLCVMTSLSIAAFNWQPRLKDNLYVELSENSFKISAAAHVGSVPAD